MLKTPTETWRHFRLQTLWPFHEQVACSQHKLVAACNFHLSRKISISSKKEKKFFWKRQKRILSLISLSLSFFESFGGKLWVLINFSLTSLVFAPAKERKEKKNLMRKLLIYQRQQEMEKDKPKSNLLWGKIFNYESQIMRQSVLLYTWNDGEEGGEEGGGGKDCWHSKGNNFNVDAVTFLQLNKPILRSFLIFFSFTIEMFVIFLLSSVESFRLLFILQHHLYAWGKVHMFSSVRACIFNLRLSFFPLSFLPLNLHPLIPESIKQWHCRLPASKLFRV